MVLAVLWEVRTLAEQENDMLIEERLIYGVEERVLVRYLGSQSTVILPEDVLRIDAHAFDEASPETLVMSYETFEKTMVWFKEPFMESVKRIVIRVKSDEVSTLNPYLILLHLPHLQEQIFEAESPFELTLCGSDRIQPSYRICAYGANKVSVSYHQRSYAFPQCILPDVAMDDVPAFLRPMILNAYVWNQDRYPEGKREPYELFLRQAGAPFFRQCLQKGYPHVLEVYLTRSFQKPPFAAASFDHFMKDAEKQENTTLLAQLMTVKNRFYDAERLEAAKEAAENWAYEHPTSERALRRLWRWKALDDDAVCITGYKGDETSLQMGVQAVMPPQVGEKTVSAIADKALTRAMATEITVPGSIEMMGRCLCFGNPYLERVTFEAGCTSVPDRAFEGCQKLREAVLSEGLGWIGNRAFYHSSIATVQFPESLKLIGREAFSHSLLSGNLTLDGTILQESAFEQCNLQEVVLRGVAFIPHRAFRSCRKLIKADCRDALSIAGYAFAACHLKELHVSIHLVGIEEDAFDCCSIDRLVVHGRGRMDSLLRAFRESGMALQESEIIRDDGENEGLRLWKAACSG